MEQVEISDQREILDFTAYGNASKLKTVLDVYREHQAMSKCYCSICWCAKRIIEQREAESEDTRPACDPWTQ